MSARRRAGAFALLAAALLAGGARAAAVVAPERLSEPAASGPADAACPPPATPITADEAKAGMRAGIDHGLLWKATKGGRSVYLYGTIHVAERAWMFPGPRVLKAVLSSDEIALELDLVDPAVMARLQAAVARKPDSPTLPDALQRRLDAQAVAACLQPAALAPMRPEMQAVTLEIMQGRRQGLYADYGIDVFLAGLGRGLKRPVRSLETPESQARLLVSDDPADTAQTVTQVLDELEGGKGPTMLGRLAGDWSRGDLADLEQYATWCGCLDTPDLRAAFAKLVDERNPLMADKIVQWHAQGKSLFVAVGSLHLLGQGGLPALLKARGFEVERVVLAAPVLQ